MKYLARQMLRCDKQNCAAKRFKTSNSGAVLSRARLPSCGRPNVKSSNCQCMRCSTDTIDMHLEFSHIAWDVMMTGVQIKIHP